MLTHSQRRAIRRETRATGVAHAVLMAMLEHANASGICWPCIATIAAESGFRHRATANALAALADLGEITDTGQRKDQVVVYRIERVAALSLAAQFDAIGADEEPDSAHHRAQDTHARDAWVGAPTTAPDAPAPPPPMHEVHTEESLYSHNLTQHDSREDLSCRVRTDRSVEETADQPTSQTESKRIASEAVTILNGCRGDSPSWNAWDATVARMMAGGTSGARIIEAAHIAHAQAEAGSFRVQSPRYLERIIAEGNLQKVQISRTKPRFEAAPPRDYTPPEIWKPKQSLEERRAMAAKIMAKFYGRAA